mgnify:CR=1 FL=1
MVRIDNLPMNRRTTGEQLYERREIAPGKEEVHRRFGSVRQALSAQALGMVASPKLSMWAIDNSFSLVGVDVSFGFSVSIGDITDGSANKWTLLYIGDTPNTSGDERDSMHCYLKKTGADYQIHLEATDSLAATDAVTPITLTPGTSVDVLVTYRGASNNFLRLNVSGQDPEEVEVAGTYGLSGVQAFIGGSPAITDRPKGTAPVIDNFHAWNSIRTVGVYQDRAPSGGPYISILPSDIGGYLFDPATCPGKVFAHPSPPQTMDDAVHFSGYGGALRIPFRKLWERYFHTRTESVASQNFSFRYVGQRRFNSATKTVFDFGGLGNLSFNSSGHPIFTYNGVSVDSGDTVKTDLDADGTIICGVNGAEDEVFINIDGTSFTESLGTVGAPLLDWQRIPDLYIGNDEDPALDKGYHGSIEVFQFFDYALDEDTTTILEPVLDLDFSGDFIRDKSHNRTAVASQPHTTAEGRPTYALGPLTDQDFTSVDNEITTGPAPIGYTGAQIAPIGTDLSTVRRGDRVFMHSGDYVHVADSELNTVRPLGLPEPQADISVRAHGVGALDGIYSYGYQYVSNDGTKGPVHRLKPVKALRDASVLVGSSEAGEDQRLLGESYGKAPAGSVSYFKITDAGDALNAITSPGASTEIALRFPDFKNFEESIFDRGCKATFTDEPTVSAEASTPVRIDPNGNFTLQFAFKLASEVLAAEDTPTPPITPHMRQSIVAIGHEDVYPEARSVLAWLDHGSSLYGDSEYRLVVARCIKNRTGNYKVIIFNDAGEEGTDAGFWVNGHDYNFILTRKENALQVRVHDRTDNEWKHFTGGAAANFFGSFNFPQSTNDFRVGNVNFRKTGNTGNHWESGVDLPATGWTTGSRTLSNSTHYYRIGWMDRGTTFYHARAWTRALTKAEVMHESWKRFAAIGNGSLRTSCKADLGFIKEDHHQTVKKFWDNSAGVAWFMHKADTVVFGNRSHPPGIMEIITGSPLEYNGLIVTDTTVNDITETQLRIYASSVGNGSIIISTNEDSYTIATRQWDYTAPTSHVKAISDLGFELDLVNHFNWFTLSTTFEDNSNDLDLSVLDVAINGKRVFNAPISSFDTPIEHDGDGNLIFYMGGLPGVTNTGETQIAEFRLWDHNRYDGKDSDGNINNETYDYLSTRVPSVDWPALDFYPTFQPSDKVSATTYTQHGSLSSDLLTLVGDASVHDTLDDNNQGDLDDPAPAIPIPQPPFPWITSISLLRSQGLRIQNIEDEEAIQRALSDAQTLPLFRLARISAGETSYVDIAPDTTLGAESPADGTGEIPENPNGIAVWQNQLGIFRGNEMWFTEPGPFGWESFPAWLRYEVPTRETGSNITAALEIQGNLIVLGSGFGQILTGAPSNPRAVSLGSGVGAQSPACLVGYGGSAFALSSAGLWKIDGTDITDFGQPVQDLLPSSGGRLAISANLSSLFVIDSVSDVVLRYYFPDDTWSIEERDAVAIGDSGTSTHVVHSSGAYSLVNTSSIYGDDVDALTLALSEGTIATSSTITLGEAADTDPSAPLNSRVLVVDSTGATATGRYTSYSSPTVTVTANLSSLTGACTIYYGVGGTGLMLDTGWIDTRSALSIHANLHSGASWEVALAGAEAVGLRSDRSGLSFTPMASTLEWTSYGGQGRHVRTVLRAFKPAAHVLSYAEIVPDV